VTTHLDRNNHVRLQAHRSLADPRRDSRCDHFLTTSSTGELAPAVGYQAEGIVFHAPNAQPGTCPVFRWYQEWDNDHFYTADPNGEGAPGSFASEGIAFHVFSDARARPNLVAVHRCYHVNTREHLCTTNPDEARLPEWSYQRVIGYVFNEAVADSQPVYRWYQTRHVLKHNFPLGDSYFIESAAGATSEDLRSAGMAERDRNPPSRFVIGLLPTGAQSAGAPNFDLRVARRIVIEAFGGQRRFPLTQAIVEGTQGQTVTVFVPGVTQSCLLEALANENGLMIFFKPFFDQPTVVSAEQLQASLLEIIDTVRDNGHWFTPGIDALDEEEGIGYGLRGLQGRHVPPGHWSSGGREGDCIQQ
jgi:hypothetical protein